MPSFKRSFAPEESYGSPQPVNVSIRLLANASSLLPFISTVLMAAAVLLSPSATAQSIAAGAYLWGSNPAVDPATLTTGRSCGVCHLTPPDIRRHNAANAVSVIDAAIANNVGLTMGQFSTAPPGTSPLNATDRQSLAMYIGSTLNATPPATVAYHGIVTIPLQDIVTTSGVPASTVITNIATVGSPVGGILGAYNLVTPSVDYTHQVNSCTDGSFVFHGSGISGALTSNRSVTISVTPPIPPSLTGPAANIAYNSAFATNIPLGLGVGPALSLVVGPLSGGAGTLNPSGTTLTYIANPSVYVASQTFTVQVVGPCASSAVATIALTVGLPPAPSVSAPAGPFSTAFNTAATAINLTPNISGVSTSIAVTASVGGTTAIAGNSVTFTPNAGFTGAGSFTYQAIGPGGTSPTTATVSITVLPAPPTVTAAPGPFSTPFNTPININLAGRVTGTFTSIATPNVTNGTTSVAGNVVTFTPTANFIGTGGFTFTATNAGGTSAPSAVMNITVLPPPPTVANRIVSATYQVPFPIDLTAQISGASTSIAVVTPPANGGTSVAGNIITYTPNALYLGPDSFTYSATGPGGTSLTNATVSITVVPPAPPTATSPPLATVTFNTLKPIDVTAQLSGVYLSVAVVTPPTNGTIASIVGNVINYLPNVGYVGADSFTYRAQGPGGTLSAPPAPVSLNVLPAVPAVTAPATVTTAFNTPAIINLTTQVTGVSSSIAIGTAAAHGTTSIAGYVVTYTPTAGYAGPDSFTFTATGPGGTSAPPTPVNITVLPAAPTVAARSVSAAFSTLLAIDLTAQITGVATSISVVTSPAHGTIVSTVGNVVTYLPTSGYTGPDSFTYRATGPGGTSAPATVSITVVNAPPPVAASRPVSVVFNTPVAIDLTPQVSGFFNSIAVGTAPVNGVIASVVGNVITYVPRAGYVGTDSFTYAATGPGGISAPATISLNVIAPPAPTTVDSAITVMFNTTSPINLTAQISGVASSIAIVTATTHGATSVTGNVVTYTPTLGYFGADSFTYTVTGPGGTSMPATVTITVSTQAPAATAFKMIVPLNTSTTMDLAPFITGSAISGVVVSALPKHGTAIVRGTKLTFTPSPDYFGGDSFSYAVFGNAGTSPAAVVTVTIVGRPDPTTDAKVTGLIAAQTDAAKRFSKAQITNFQSRMESLHRVDASALTPAPEPEPTPDAGRATVARNASSNGDAKSSAVGKTPPRENTYLYSSYALAPLPPNAAATQKSVPFLSDAVSFLSAGSINLASLASSVAATAGNATKGTIGGPSFWLAGSANFGTRTATGERVGLDFTTSGISMGVDRRFGDQLVLGAGLGFARDKTDIGTDGSRSRSRAVTGVAYGSYQPSTRTFIDGLVGVGTLDFKNLRHVAAIDDIASSDRKGRQFFGSISGGIEYRDNGVLLSPYARFDYTSDRLNQTTETGAGLYALTYFNQTTPSIQAALGVRAESVHLTSFGSAAPRLRAEYRHEFQGERQTSIGYADSVGGRFGITTGAIAKNALVLGIGSEFIYRGGWTLGVDYQLEKSMSFSKDSSQGIKFTITKDLDGKDSPYSLVAAAISPKKPQDIQVDAGIMFDSNVTRSKLSGEKLADRIYSVNASKSRLFEINENIRATVTGSFGGNKFDNYFKLSNASLGLQGEIVYRPTAAFDAPTFAAFIQTSAEHYQSMLRNGYRYSVGVSARKPLTDRIDLFGALSHNERYGKSAVFSNRFNAARVNVDYNLSTTETVYVSGEYRRGQIVSTGLPSLENIEVAEVFVQDDAYPGGQFFSYRFDGRTVLSTVGYNVGLGARHSLDLSWRRAQSTPSFRPAFPTSASSYIADQYSIVYLVRF